MKVVYCPWLMVGDFNVIQRDEELIGGNSRPLASMEEFNSCLDQCGIVELYSGGQHMSWCNG